MRFMPEPPGFLASARRSGQKDALKQGKLRPKVRAGALVLGLCCLGVVVGRTIMSCGGGGTIESCADLTTPELRAAYGQQLGCGFGGSTRVCSPRLVTGAVDDACGIFVSPKGSPVGTGSKADPVDSLKAGIALLTRQWPRLYLCEGTFSEETTIPMLVEVYGGLDCTTWVRVGNGVKTKLTAPPEKIPLTLEGGTDPVTVEDVHVIAADAVTPGGSSIAAVVNHAETTLRDVVFEAGEAQPGADGELMPDAVSGAKGATGPNGCVANHTGFSEKTTNRCDGEPISVGGEGGSGEFNWGQLGHNGLPQGADNGGSGYHAMHFFCTDGGPGNDGIDGVPGTGGSGLGIVTTWGYRGITGNPGKSGKVGQGGGGGGGFRGDAYCGNLPMKGGPSGGGGGSGGCGGLGGLEGKPGGSSFGMISLKATFTFESVVVKAKNAGRGGNGGLGQAGGMPGAGGEPGVAPPTMIAACFGGPGGRGGNGGQGGGATGGHSVAIAFSGHSPLAKGVTMERGEAGMGGTGADALGAGSNGVSADAHAF